MTIPNTYQGEAMLLRWGDNNASGRTVTFQLPEDDPHHPFKGYPSGAKNGQRFMLVAVPISEEEKVDEGAIAKARVPLTEKHRSQQAALLIQQDRFRDWYWHHRGRPDEGEEVTENAIKERFNVERKRDLDTLGRETAHAFDQMVRDYRTETGQTTEQRG